MKISENIFIRKSLTLHYLDVNLLPFLIKYIMLFETEKNNG